MTDRSADRPPPEVADSDASTTDHQIHDESMTENTDDASAAELLERVDELEAQIEQLQQTIQQMSPSRRWLLRAGGAGVAGLLAASAASGSASAASGTIGSSSQRFDFYGGFGDFNSLDTKQADITNEADIIGTLNAPNNNSSGTWVNIIGGSSKDARNELNASNQFVPDETGEYEISGTIQINVGNTGDIIRARIQDVDGSSTVQDLPKHTSGGFRQMTPVSWSGELTGGQAYEVQVTDDNSSYDIVGNGYLTIHKEVVDA